MHVFESLFQVLILEPSKVLQPAVVSVSEEDMSRTVQLKHVSPLKVVTKKEAYIDLFVYNISVYCVLLCWFIGL